MILLRLLTAVWLLQLRRFSGEEQLSAVQVKPFGYINGGGFRVFCQRQVFIYWNLKVNWKTL